MSLQQNEAITGSVGSATASRRMLIDGQLTDAAAHFVSLNPSTGGEVGYAPDGTVASAEAAVTAARRAFDTTSWASDPGFRAHCLDQLHHALVDNIEELRSLTIAEVGSTRQLTYAGQLAGPIEIVRYYADLLPRFSFIEDFGAVDYLGQQHRRWVEKEAAGVVSAIIAYNYPNQLALAKLAPALAAGCTVVLKAAPQTPLVTLALGELIAQHTDIPSGVVNVISSSDVAVGELMTTHPAVDLVSFTGSTAVGRQIMGAASKTLKRVFLELGGKSAAIVLDDGDFVAAAQFAAFSMALHAGQGCALTSRLVVPRDHYDEIVELAAANFARVSYGDPHHKRTYMGPLISQQQRQKVAGMVSRAVADGAQLVCGGEEVNPGYFYTPTLLTNIDPNSEIAQEEVFGPVLVVLAHDGDDDAVRIANDSVYGLSGAVFSADDQRALAVARRIRTGTLGINGGNYFHPDVPFGGYKQSGIGREMGVAGLEEFLQRKTLAQPVVGDQ
ncbi:aldehyde dehydrogenase [Mycobacterium colombiense]|uniref:aldehyde dehydrogenase family protein n=1 Tax=Mycobacterium colombiense TaxID=339268 RepID=UPI0007F03C15|nr:aldehyde dehydrogenase family protein [Mycobacterium colombiense]OBK63205.1 aldehyde dehydrogenase [Mycobacterium colombiense]